jgi:hypothetical protein
MASRKVRLAEERKVKVGRVQRMGGKIVRIVKRVGLRKGGKRWEEYSKGREGREKGCVKR